MEAAREVESTVALAHVRAATVGQVAFENTHPFSSGVWGFAHNGTLAGMPHVASHLDLDGVDPPTGDTDSELIFHWLLARMRRHGLDPLEPAPSIEPVVGLLSESVLDLVDISIRAGATRPSQLNFLLTDGRHLAAVRWGNSLWWLFRRGVADCSVCGTSHCPGADDAYRAVVVASEPLTDEAWVEMHEGTVIGVTPDARVVERDLLTRAIEAS